MFSLFIFSALQADAGIIEKIPVLQPVGILYVRALPAYRGQPISWKVAGYTIDEASGVYAATDTLLGSGDSVRVLAIKYATKYSFYKVYAAVGAEKDSLELQAFMKGSIQPYLFRSPAFATKPIPVHIYLPASFSPSSAMVVVMHGVDRNAYSYALSWTGYAAAANTIVVAPEFNATNWTSDAYSQGNMFTGSDGTGSLNPNEKWTFTIVSDIQRTIARGFGLRDSTFILWGHSAGAQFVHRKLLFSFDPLIKVALSANAGWYTALDTTILFPWGVSHPFLSLTGVDLQQFVSRNLILMRGTADTIRDSNLNTDPLSDAQGKNRYQRAGYFYRSGVAVSSSLTWKLIDVPNVGHEYQKMAAAAGEYLSKGTTLVERTIQSVNSGFDLSSYPNPFNPSTTVRFSVPSTSVTTLMIYSMLGERIQTLVDKVLDPGVYTVMFDGTTLANGVYVCRLSSGAYSSSVKLVLLK